MLIGWYLSRALSIPYASPKDKYLLSWLGVESTFVIPDSILRVYTTYDQKWRLWWWCKDRWKRTGKMWIGGHGFSLLCKNLDLDPHLSDMINVALFNTAQLLWASVSTNCDVVRTSVCQIPQEDALCKRIKSHLGTTWGSDLVGSHCGPSDLWWLCLEAIWLEQKT